MAPLMPDAMRSYAGAIKTVMMPAAALLGPTLYDQGEEAHDGLGHHRQHHAHDHRHGPGTLGLRPHDEGGIGPARRSVDTQVLRYECITAPEQSHRCSPLVLGPTS